MVAVLDTRYFEYELYKMSDAKPFATAQNWVHYARIIPYIDETINVLKDEYPNADLVQSRHREIWKGEFDGQIVGLSSTLPSALENNPLTMQSRIKEQLDPIRTLISALSALPVMVVNGKDASADAKGTGTAAAQDVRAPSSVTTPAHGRAEADRAARVLPADLEQTFRLKCKRFPQGGPKHLIAEGIDFWDHPAENACIYHSTSRTGWSKSAGGNRVSRSVSTRLCAGVVSTHGARRM